MGWPLWWGHTSAQQSLISSIAVKAGAGSISEHSWPTEGKLFTPRGIWYIFLSPFFIQAFQWGTEWAFISFLSHTSYRCSLDWFCSHRLRRKAATEGGYGDTGISNFASVMSMQTSYFPHNLLSRAVRRKKFLGKESWRFFSPTMKEDTGNSKERNPQEDAFEPHMSHLALWMMFSAYSFCSPKTLICNVL